MTVDVDVLPVKTRAALLESLSEHRTNGGEQLRGFSGAESRGGVVVVQSHPPERLVGIDIADSADQLLIQKGPLHPGVLCPKPADEDALVERRVKRVTADVGHLGGDEWSARPLATGLSIRSRAEVVEGQRAKHTLIDETKPDVATIGVNQVKRNTKKTAEITETGGEKNLTTHAEMPHESTLGVIAVAENPPQELPPACHLDQGLTGETVDKILRGTRVALERPRIENHDLVDAPRSGEREDPSTDDLHFG